MSHAIKSGDNWTLCLDNAAAWENNALVQDRLMPLTCTSVNYAPDKVAIDAETTTEASLWYAQRKREYELVKRLYTTDERVAYKQMCVFEKRDNLHKRLVAIVMYTPRGNVWFDVTTTCKVTPRGKLGYRKVSESIARELLGTHEGTTVYLQSFKEVLHEHAHRMQDRRRYHGAMKNAPKDRRVAPYILPAHYSRAESKAIEEALENAYLEKKWG